MRKLALNTRNLQWIIFSEVELFGGFLTESVRSAVNVLLGVQYTTNILLSKYLIYLAESGSQSEYNVFYIQYNWSPANFWLIHNLSHLEALLKMVPVRDLPIK